MKPIVLVVDDEPDVLLMVRTLLQLAGHQVLEADSAERALELLEQERPDAILLDIRLPGMSGWDMLDRLRAEETLKDHRVIVFSANIDATMPSKVAAYGCRGHIPKPFLPDQLIDTVGRVLAEAS